MSEDAGTDKRRAERWPLSAPAQFIVQQDVVEAESVDISETGVRISTSEPLNICVRVEEEGRLAERYARLVWARKEGEGMVYGFAFTRSE